MSKISTDRNNIEELVTRGVEKIYPTPNFLRSQLLSGKKLTIYLGIDPTGPVLHLGHAIPLMKLAQFQTLGHKIILLIGDFTAMAGDPDKTEARKALTRKEILANCKNYKKQASRILRFAGTNPAEYRFNSTWLSKMHFSDVISLASKETVQRMLERDLFEKRRERGSALYIHEFLYPLMQGYDSVAMNVDGEVGGNDQTFNMLTGRDLLKQYKKKEKFVIATKLLVDTTGKKMGKTEGNMVTLADSPVEMFGKIMSWTDTMIVPALEVLTVVPMSDIQNRDRLMKEGKLNPRDAKVELAKLVVSFYHSAKEADAAEAQFVKTFAKKETPDDMPTIKAPKGSASVADVMVHAKLASSKSEARRLIEQGGVSVNKTRVTDATHTVALQPGDVIQVGKRRFVRII